MKGGGSKFEVLFRSAEEEKINLDIYTTRAIYMLRSDDI
jgi:hypothetical protein